MANLSQLLKQEITRIARKELRQPVAALKQTVTRQRTEIAVLKREVAALKHQLSESSRIARKRSKIDAATNGDGQIRYSAKNLAALRRRLDLSQQDFGTLLGVSKQTIYNLEAGNGRPSRDTLMRIVAARKLGRRDAQAIIGNAA